MTAVITLDGNIRESLGSSNARRLRKADRLLAVIYNTEDKNNVLIDLDMKQFEMEFEKGGFQTKIIEIKTPKKTYKTVAYQLDFDPVTDRVRHIDFMSVENKKKVKVFVPVKVIDKEKSSGLKKAGYLNLIARKLHLWCDVDNIPQIIEVSVDGLRLQQSVMSSQVKLPNGCEYVSKKDFMILSILGRGKDEDETTPTTTTATATPADTKAPAKTEEKK